MSDKLIMHLKEIDDCPVLGHLQMIDDTRFVFIGEDPSTPEVIYLGFRSVEGQDTKIVLSREAYQVLKYLITEPFKGKRVPFPYKSQWQVMVEEITPQPTGE